MADGRKVNFPLNENDCTHLNDALRPITTRRRKCAKMVSDPNNEYKHSYTYTD